MRVAGAGMELGDGFRKLRRVSEVQRRNATVVSSLVLLIGFVPGAIVSYCGCAVHLSLAEGP